jgi:N,N'-diacetylbacillosaminyl-diphospho-undecaprenol alpha-1,3-N-acetylgalactosaminyltransferase
MRFAFLSSLDLNLYLFRLDIMKALQREGHEVIAIVPRGDYFQKLQDNGIETVEYSLNRGSLSPLSAISSIRELSKLLKSLNLDLLHTFTVKPNIFGTVAGKMAGVPKIVNLVEGMGSFYVDNSLKSRVVRTIIEGLYKQVFKLSNQTVFVNSDDPEYLIGKGIIPREKVKVISSVGIDIEEYSPDSVSEEVKAELKEKLNISKDQPVITMIGRAILHKGTKDFYKSAEMLSGEGYRFLFVGDIDRGNRFSMTEEFMNSVSDVSWLGFRSDIKELLAISDIVVLPSYREGVPRTLLEAGAMGKPMIATDVIGCREVVQNGVNGYLVPLNSPKDISDKIKFLLSSRELYNRISTESRKDTVNRFNLTSIVDKYMENYRRILDESR